MFCKECNDPILNSDKRSVFCGKSCSAKFNNTRRIRTSAWRDTVSRSMKRAIAEGRAKVPITSVSKQIEYTCDYCGLMGRKYRHTSRTSSRIYCSRKCSNADASKNLKGKCGGYRIGSGRSKTGWYKGYYCASTYELAWVIYHLDHNIPFTRNTEGFPYVWEGSQHLYYPDFIVDGVGYVEVKGFKTDRDLMKWAMFPHTLQVMLRRDLRATFAHVLDVYGVKEDELYTLYEQYRPAHSYTCDQCLTVFTTDRPRKTSKVFCSQSCAGKHRSQVKHAS